MILLNDGTEAAGGSERAAVEHAFCASHLSTHLHHHYPHYHHIHLTLTVTSTMPQDAPIDKRGYVFQLPTLALPEPAGEWKLIRVAIGRRAEATRLLRDESVAAPRRYAGLDNAMADVEYESAFWLLPCLAPTTTSSSAEVFTLKVRRFLAYIHKRPSRPKVTAGQGKYHLTHPMGITAFELSPEQKARVAKENKSLNSSSGPPTEASEEAWWRTHFGPFFDLVSRAAARGTIERLGAAEARAQSGDGGWQDQATRDSNERFMEGPRGADKTFKRDWMLERFKEAKDEAIRAGMKLGPPTMSVRVDESRLCVEFMARVGVDDSPPRQDEWKRVPKEAMLPGAELELINGARKSFGLPVVRTPSSQASLQRRA